jgi:phosphomevalonate kinase
VAASTFGGTLLAKRGDDATLSLTPITLSNELFVEVWATGRAASTSDMLARVSELKRTYADRFQTLMGRQIRAAETAAAAVSTGSAHQFIGALTAQHDALRDLGQAAGIPIVVDAVRQLHTLARTSGACVLPAGAGGGDISLYTGTKPPGAQLVALARRLGQKPLNLRFGVRGLHRTQQGTAQP